MAVDRLFCYIYGIGLRTIDGTFPFGEEIMRAKKGNRKYTIISLCSVLFVLMVWYICINVLHLKQETVFPGPVTVAKTFIQKLYTKAPDGATLIVHLASSLKVALFGYFLGVVFGVPMGILMAWFKWVDRLVRPLFDLIRPVPGLAWIPMFILLFGIGIMPKAAVIFLSTAVACIVNSYTGIRQTKQEHLWVGDVFGATNLQKLFRIAIPTAFPMIFTGLRVAMGAAWMALVAAELLAASEGLGYMIQQGRYSSKPALVFVGMLMIGFVGLVFDTILHWLEKKVAKGMNAE